MLPPLKKLAQDLPVIWLPQNAINKAFATIFISAESNSIIQEFNKAAARALADSGVIIWWNYNQIYEFFGDTSDGIHIGPKSRAVFAQIIFNFLCQSTVTT